MTDDIIVLYGKKRLYRQDNSVLLLTDLIDDYVSHNDKNIFSEHATRKLHNVIDWLGNNGITEDCAMIGMYYYKMVHTHSTSVKYFIIFDKTEHRMLFILSKDNVLNTEVTS